MRRPAEEVAKTREALLWSALETFAQAGWKGATFEKVAERAGVTRGALHHHFRSKQVLLAEALDTGWAYYSSKLFGEDTIQGGTALPLESLFREFIVMLQNDSEFRSLVSTTVLVAPQAFEASRSDKDALGVWSQSIEHSLIHSGISTERASTAAGLVIVVLQGLTVTAVTRPQDLPSKDHLDWVTKGLAQGITG